MKKYLALAICSVFFAIPLAKAGDAFDAKLVEIKIFKGDKGKGNKNTCDPNFILVHEAYEVTNTSLKDIVLAHYSSATGALTVKYKNWTNAGTNYLANNYCVEKGFKSNITAKFLNAQDINSNIIKFTVDIDKLDLREASTFPPAIMHGKIHPTNQ